MTPLEPGFLTDRELTVVHDPCFSINEFLGILRRIVILLDGRDAPIHPYGPPAISSSLYVDTGDCDETSKR